jgi:hypothetical protein
MTEEELNAVNDFCDQYNIEPRALAFWLHGIANHAIPVMNQAMGVCYNMADYFGFGDVRHMEYAIRVVRELACDWPFHSGNDIYPVPISAGNIWEGGEGNQRRNLCLFIAQKIMAHVDDNL